MGRTRADGAKIKDQSGIFALLLLNLRYFCDHLRFCTLFMPFLSLFPFCLRPNFTPFVLYFSLFVRFLPAFCPFFLVFWKCGRFSALNPTRASGGVLAFSRAFCADFSFFFFINGKIWKNHRSLGFLGWFMPCFFAFLNIFVVKYTNKNKKDAFVTQKHCKKQAKRAYFSFWFSINS